MHREIILSTCVIFLTVVVSSVNSETISCKTGVNLIKYCLVKFDQPYANIKRTTIENPFVKCVEGTSYGYLFYSSIQAYIWARIGCGGTFQVTKKATTGDAKTWANWGAWTACSITCGAGYRLRARTCPGGIATACGTGSSTASEICTKPVCPSATTWNQWGAWTACSKSCDTGAQIRTRTCTSGSIYGCINLLGGSSQDTRICNSKACSTKVPTTSSSNSTNSPLCGRENVFGYRIIGGTSADECQYPWMALIYNRYSRTICGGSIIDSTHILTAAHCLYSKNNVRTEPDYLAVLTGSSKMPLVSYDTSAIRRVVESVKIHEDFDSTYLDNDIAIVTLTKAIKFNSCHRPVCLPDKEKSAIGLDGCKVMGWGKTRNSKFAAASPRLIVGDINVESHQSCAAVYRQYYNQISKLCGGGAGEGSCAGDSGGPLLCPNSEGRYYQYAIVSAGKQDSCGVDPGLYTKVSHFLGWIKNNSK